MTAPDAKEMALVWRLVAASNLVANDDADLLQEAAAEIERLREDLTDKATAWDVIAEKNAEIDRLSARCEDGAAEIERLELAVHNLTCLKDALDNEMGEWQESTETAESQARDVREQAIEECAQLVDQFYNVEPDNTHAVAVGNLVCEQVAEAIRALASRPAIASDDEGGA